MLTLTPYTAVAGDTDSLADPVSAGGEMVIVRTPDVLFLQLVGDVIVFGASQCRHQDPFCDRRPVDAARCGDVDFGVGQHGVVGEMVDARGEEVD